MQDQDHGLKDYNTDNKLIIIKTLMNSHTDTT